MPKISEVISDAQDRVINLLMEDEKLQALVHKATLLEMGYEESEVDSIRVGGNLADRVHGLIHEHKWTITEDDPKYERYWDLHSHLWGHIVTVAALQLGAPWPWHPQAKERADG